MTVQQEQEYLARIAAGLQAAAAIFADYTPGDVETAYKSGDDPVTKADHAVDAALRPILQRAGEGWLSEETIDDLDRLKCSVCWVVDPLDGTREFVKGIPEWCVSIGLVEDGRALAGGIYNPQTKETFLGSLQTGVTYNGAPAVPKAATSLQGARVLASRSEMSRGEWDGFASAGFVTVPMGSVAYKLARVAAGLDEVTFTLVPKNEWDVAAGVALVESAGGFARDLSNSEIPFNCKSTLLTGMFAGCPGVQDELTTLLAPHIGELAAR